MKTTGDETFTTLVPPFRAKTVNTSSRFTPSGRRDVVTIEDSTGRLVMDDLGTRQYADRIVRAMNGEPFDGQLALCPKCGAEDSMEHVKDVDLQDHESHYDQCALCSYKTDPE